MDKEEKKPNIELKEKIIANEENENENNITKEMIEELSVTLSRKTRIFIFCLFLVLSIVVDLDNGIFSASVKTLQSDLGMNNTQYGLFVSISFIGRIIGLVFFMIIINFKHRKFTLILSIVLHGSSYSLYKVTNNSQILTFSKMFSAANKVCASVFRPVWIEQFGLSDYKSIFLSLVQIMSSYGQNIGFDLGTLYFKEKWKTALIYIMILMLFIAFCFCLVPKKYFYRKYMFYENKLIETIDENDVNNSNITVNKSDLSSTSTSSKKSKRKTLFVDSNKLEKLKNEKYNCKKLLKDLCSLLKNKIYILSIIKRSINTFIFQIIHSYLKPYQEKTFQNCNEKMLVLFYNISNLVATMIGGLIGGVLTKKLGGYESKKSIFILLISEILSNVNIFFLTFTLRFYVYNINLMLLFFFMSASLPIILGYLIITIPKRIKGIGIGLDMIVSTFLGKIPGPIIYGALEDKYSEKNPSLAWKCSLSYYYFGFLIVFILCCFKCKEEIKEGVSKVRIQDSIVDIAALGSGSDSNDHFRLSVPAPKIRSKTFSKKKTITEMPMLNDGENLNDSKYNEV